MGMTLTSVKIYLVFYSTIRQALNLATGYKQSKSCSEYVGTHIRKHFYINELKNIHIILNTVPQTTNKRVSNTCSLLNLRN